jgi:hypothetical protein
MSHTVRRRGRRRRHVQHLTAVVITCTTTVSAACGAGAERNSISTTTGDVSASKGSSVAPMSTSADGASKFRVVIGDTTVTGHLFDNATARGLASQLPLTLTFSDLHGVEKGAPLLRKLSVEGMPAGDDPEIGDLGYWAPDGHLVLYYGDVDYWTGIMRIGHFDGDMQALSAQSGDFDATIELVR